MTPRRSLVGRLLAAMLIRGSEAPFVRRDLDDSFTEDLARGMSVPTARRRDLENIVSSAWSLGASTLRASSWRPSLIDVRLGLRGILRTPGLSLVAVCALAIGIPVGLAPMQAVRALERPLPGDAGGRIRTLSYWRDSAHQSANAGDFFFWKNALRSFESIAAYRPIAANIDGDTRSVSAIETTSAAFDILRVPAALGRVLRADDERVGAPNVVVIGNDLWRERFNADVGVVGRMLTIGGVPFAVVGVMPPAFRFPTAHQLWMPLRIGDDGGGPRSGAALVVFGKLFAGVTPESAQAELDTVTSVAAAQEPGAFERLRAQVLPSWNLTFGFPSPGGLRALPEFYIVQLLMFAPLVVACVNVGLLVLAQTSTRASEFALRTALGASRARILTQVFVEFLVLAVIATGVGLLLLNGLPSRLLPALGITIPYWIDTGLDVGTALQGLALAAGCAVIAGVMPALRMTGRAIDANIKRTRANRSGNRLGGFSTALIVVDVAVAVVSIGVAAGLWGKVQATRPSERFDGVRAAEILAVAFTENGGVGNHSAPRAQGGVENHSALRLIESLRAEPEVRAVTFATALPRMDHSTELIEADAETASSSPFKVRTARVAADFFDQLAQPMIAGRRFDARDLAPDARAVIVNATFAERAFGTTNVVGKRVRQATSDRASVGPWLEIVGVVGHLGAHALTPSEDDALYRPMALGSEGPIQIAVWTRGNPSAFVPRLRELARTAAPGATLGTPRPLDDMFEGDWYFLRAFVVAAIVLVGVLLSLAASALYAILSLVVSQRTREIGIRAALGANRFRIARDIAARAVAQISIGVVIGLPFAGALCYEFLELRGAGSLPAAAVMTSGLGLSVLVLVSFAACTVPTLRALRIHPIDALRKDN